MNCVYNIPSWVLHYIQETSMEDRLANLKGYLSNTKTHIEPDTFDPTKESQHLNKRMNRNQSNQK